tara:strand:- start:380 stop:1486 length:1107 start_codon:yes stop_codon:yes gene_type:complete
MLLILHPNIKESSTEYKITWQHLSGLEEIRLKKHKVQGKGQNLTEIYLIGNTSKINQEEIEALPAVESVVRISHDFRILGRHSQKTDSIDFEYNGIRFNQNNFHIFAGLCAVDNRQNVKLMMKALQSEGQKCTRMGAYKPRTNPYSFQGHGKSCLNYVFDLAGDHDIKIIAMEVTHESQIEEIDESLEKLGRPTGVILQIGTRNTQNFELLKAVGRQHNYPVLLKRGFGISLNESLNAAEYLASEGNNQVIFCLRGMKTSFNAPHRNMVDFAHIPIVRRLTRMPVCIDPSHSVGTREISPDGILDVLHSTSQGIVAGANMVLVDFHPSPKVALVDGPQALLLDELGRFIEDVNISRETYKKRVSLWNK